MRFGLDHEGRLRYRALFDLAIDSKLRGCDVVKIGDLVSGGRIRTRAPVVQRKTKRPVQFEFLEAARGSLHGGSVAGERPTTTPSQAALTLYGTHSLRRTKAPIIYNATGNLRAVQILLGHTKIESTARYLGVDVEDDLALAEDTEV